VLAWVSTTAAVISGAPPPQGPVQLTLHRPSTWQDQTVNLTPSALPPPPLVSATAPRADIAEVKLAAFGPNAEATVFTAITNLHLGEKLRGVILDLRGNGGGSPTEVPACWVVSYAARSGVPTSTETATARPTTPTTL
jgi:C-terminal processing protease CtpA/Prc